MVQSWVEASSEAWGPFSIAGLLRRMKWQSSKNGITIPKSFSGYGLAFAETSGFEAATHYGATDQRYSEYDLFEPCRNVKTLILRHRAHPAALGLAPYNSSLQKKLLKSRALEEQNQRIVTILFISN